MKPFSMNLSKFKKIAQDHLSTTLKDPNGHEIKILHSKLPAIQKKQLEGLPTAFSDGTPDPEQPDASLPPESPASKMAEVPVNAQVGATPENVNLMASDQTLNAPAAVGLEQKAAREQQAIDAAKGAQTANIEKGYNDQKSALVQQEQSNLNTVKGHADDYAKYISSNPINPNHYQESLDTGRRVTNALGLLAGGLGQGLVGGSNPAMDFINHQIDRDIDAQKARSENQKTVYGAYRELYGDQVAATNAAKASLLDIYNHKMQLVAAQLGTPQARANADAFAAKTAIERNQLLLDTAGRLGTLNMGQTLGANEPAAPSPGASVQKAGSNTAVASDPEKPWYQKSPAEALHDAAGNAVSSVMDLSTTAKHSEALENQNKSEDYYDSHILAPDAVQHFKRLAYTPKAKEDLAAIQHQYNGAVQADKALGDISNTFSKLAGETNALSGRIHRGVNPHAIGAVGGGLGLLAGSIVPGLGNVAGAGAGAAAGEALGHGVQALTNTAANREYDSDKTSLLGYVSAALKGTNIGSGQIQEVVDQNAPEAGDPPALVAKKLKNIKEFIINHTDTSLLKTWGLSKR